MGNLVWLLGKGLSIEENERSEEAMLIELLLALVLNLLHEPRRHRARRAADAISDKETLRALLRCMEREHTLETVLYILQQVEENPTFRNFNLTLLEIVYYALSAQSAEALYTPPPKPPPPKPRTANEAAAQRRRRPPAALTAARYCGGGKGAVAEAALEDATAEGEREVRPRRRHRRSATAPPPRRRRPAHRARLAHARGGVVAGEGRAWLAPRVEGVAPTERHGEPAVAPRQLWRRVQGEHGLRYPARRAQPHVERRRRAAQRREEAREPGAPADERAAGAAP